MKQLAITRSKAAAGLPEALPLPACQQHVVAVQKKASGLASRVDICLPETKATVRNAREPAVPIKWMRSPRRRT